MVFRGDFNESYLVYSKSHFPTKKDVIETVEEDFGEKINEDDVEDRFVRICKANESEHYDFGDYCYRITDVGGRGAHSVWVVEQP